MSLKAKVKTSRVTFSQTPLYVLSPPQDEMDGPVFTGYYGIAAPSRAPAHFPLYCNACSIYFINIVSDFP
ncbi:hypothetical protein J6590_079318 [Homalodisca vitripennis]|nr:hypothetical protein J6590_079318 [Homalodisca vitripennis]